MTLPDADLQGGGRVPRVPILASREGFAGHWRQVKVVQTVDGARAGERAVVEAEQVERSQAFLRLADRHLDASATVLVDGNVLITGGWQLNSDQNSLDTTEIFDPAAQ
jgi:hypothetical protein